MLRFCRNSILAHRPAYHHGMPQPGISRLPLPAGTATSMPDSSSSHTSSMIQCQGRRWNWQVFLTKKYDRKSNEFKYQDWNQLLLNFKEPSLHHGRTLLQRHWQQTEHIKPTEQRRRINAAKTYRRSVKRVQDLTAYIRFIQEHDDDYNDDAPFVVPPSAKEDKTL